MEPYDPSAALTNDVTVHRAEGVLAALLDVSILDAAVSLDLRAQFRALSLEATAQQVLDDHERRISVAAPRRDIDDRALAVLRQHLDRASSPLDAPTS
jgi:hypothetical protein